MARFWDQLYESMRLREVMSSNYEKNYVANAHVQEAQYRMMVFDGDYFQRVVQLLLRRGNRRDVKAYVQYKVIKTLKCFWRPYSKAKWYFQKDQQKRIK